MMLRHHSDDEDAVIVATMENFVQIVALSDDCRPSRKERSALFSVRFDGRLFLQSIAALESCFPGLSFFRVPPETERMVRTVIDDCRVPRRMRRYGLGAFGVVVEPQSLPLFASLSKRLGPWLEVDLEKSDPSLCFDDGRPVEVKVVDLGNACWTDHHFSEDIQTRQYRAPEVILGASYCTPADMWSVACLVFELATGDLLFDPTAGDDYSRDDDHLAQALELLGPMPRHVALVGKHSRDFFNRKGLMRNIRKLRNWPLKSVLMEKYDIDRAEATLMSDFLEKCLRYATDTRATAAECLKHPWLARP